MVPRLHPDPFVDVLALPEDAPTVMAAAAKELQQLGVDLIVSNQCHKAWADALRQASGLPVELVDERMTTAAAERSLIASGVRRDKRRLVVDGVAATLLLQGHLDSKRAG